MLTRLAAWSMRRPVHHTLIFHRVLPEKDPMSPDEPTTGWFARLVDMLANRFEIIGLDDAVRRAEAGELKGHTLSVTFDDGYADNYTLAMPELRRVGAPATFFVASGFLDGGRMWNDTIIETFRHLPAGRHAIDLPGVGEVELNDWDSRRNAAMRTITGWKHLPPDERQSLVDSLASRAKDLPDDLMMTSEQLRDLAAQPGMTIGGHTRSHPILASLSADEARREIETGKSDLEGILQQPVRVFAYPNGKHGRDFRDEHAEIVRDAGFDLAVATDWGVMSNTSNRYQVPRFTPWHSNLDRFAIDLARCHYGRI
jgi:peptidoglycan/xylan/chitin deacetylase (PgdA/CDA1 family)